MFEWASMSMGYDAGLAKRVKVGDLVKHINAGWARVLRVVPQPDRTAELQVGDLKGDSESPIWKNRWWGTYHCVDWAPTYDVPREAP